MESKIENKSVYRVNFTYRLKNGLSTNRVCLTRVIVNNESEVKSILENRYPFRNIVSINKVEKVNGMC